MLRRPLRLVLRPILVVLAVAWVPFAALAAVDLDAWWPIPSLVAFLPYAVLATLLVAALAIVLKARVVALIAIAGLIILIAPRTGRFTADAQPAANGPRLVVGTANVRFGQADPVALARLVRERRIDVLALQEDTPDFTEDLTATGIRTRLPYGTIQAAPGARGISVYSRYPITTVPRKRGDQRTVGGIITLPGGQQLHVRSAHPPPPFSQSNLPRWKATTRAMAATARSTPIPTVIAGDFNASLDHYPFSSLIAAGFRDAADQTGNAWRPTWNNGRWATLTLDHVLIPPSLAARTITIDDAPGSDHDLVTATLQLPR